MKKFITIILLLLVSNVYSQKIMTPVIPDVMGNISVINNEFAKSVFAFEANAFTLFPGFPIHIQYNTQEGAIYCNMDSDPEFEIVYNIGYTVQAFNLDGSSVPGWPKTVASYPMDGSPSFGDIDGDGQGEIVVTNHGATSGGYIYAYKKNGTVCTGFPVNHGYTTRTPVLADVNNDGKMEIIVNKRTYPTGWVYVYKGDGTVLTGWPKATYTVPASSAAVGDIDNDGIPEIITESLSSIYAFKPNGDSIPGFPFVLPNGDITSYSSPVLADVDNDNKREIIFGTHSSSGVGFVYILKQNATVLTGWPKTTDNWVYGPPAVGFIDNDNVLDISVGDQVLSGTPADKLYAWNVNGTALTGFPVTGLNAINDQVSLADIDGDGMTELIIDDNTQTLADTLGQYLAFNHDGTPVAGWPLITKGTTMFSTPCFGDLDGNGILDMTGAGIQGFGNSSYTNVYAWNTGMAYAPLKNYVPMWQYNTRHNGVYGDYLQVGINTIETKIPEKFSLYQNYPNPFNPSTNIRFEIPKGGQFVSLKVYNILGREVAILVNQQLNPGSYEVQWNAGKNSSGVYFYRLETVSFTDVKRMLLVK
jgi:hypothetical protein